MEDFSLNVPQNCKFGIGALKKLPELLKECGSDNVLLVSDHSLETLGVVEKVKKIIVDAGIKYNEYLEVQPNPTADIINDAANKYKTSGATAFLALGGGSAMDTAKGAGVVAKFGGSVSDYEGMGKVPSNIDPLIAIPTTAGTGSEMTISAVITDEARNYKLSILSPNIIAKYAILDPELIMTAPASIAASCGIDALIHAMEAYTNNMANPFSDAFAEKAMEQIGAYLRRFVANRKDVEAACAMMVGSNFAGIACSNALLGNIHAMSHPVSGYFHVAHGIANAVLMPTVFQYNALADKGRYAKIYKYITGKDAGPDFVPTDLVDALKELNADIGIPACLEDVGVTEDKIPLMVEDAMKSKHVQINQRATTAKDIEALYRKAMH